MKKTRLRFMIVPSFLTRRCYVKDRVKVKIVNPDSIFITGLLGESGKKMIRAGIPFYFEKELAETLIKNGVGIKVR